MAKKRIIGIMGLGHVGAHVAYSLAIQGIADELVLVDQNEQKVASEVQDLRDAVAYMPHRVTVRAGDLADLGQCDVIVNSVGKIELLRGNLNRVTEMDFTIPAVRGFAEYSWSNSSLSSRRMSVSLMISPTRTRRRSFREDLPRR